MDYRDRVRKEQQGLEAWELRGEMSPEWKTAVDQFKALIVKPRDEVGFWPGGMTVTGASDRIVEYEYKVVPVGRDRAFDYINTGDVFTFEFTINLDPPVNWQLPEPPRKPETPPPRAHWFELNAPRKTKSVEKPIEAAWEVASHPFKPLFRAAPPDPLWRVFQCQNPHDPPKRTSPASTVESWPAAVTP